MRQTPISRANPQQEAIHTTEGPLLIIAGPGSGKTFTLVERIYHLISEQNIQPEQLFVSTFTEKDFVDMPTVLKVSGDPRSETGTRRSSLF